MWPNLNLAIFTKEILNGKLHFLFIVTEKTTPSKVFICEFYKVFQKGYILLNIYASNSLDYQLFLKVNFAHKNVATVWCDFMSRHIF